MGNIGAFGAPKAHLAPNGARLAGWPAGQLAGWLRLRLRLRICGYEDMRIRAYEDVRI